MSAQSDQPYDDQPERRRPFSTLLSSLTPNSHDDREATADDEDTSAVDTTTAVDTTAGDTGVVAPQPTFTAREDLPAAPPVAQPETAAGLDPVDDTMGEPVTGTVYEAGSVDDEDLADDDLDDAPATSAPVPTAPRANGEALPGFRRASTERDSARGYPRHAVPGTAEVIDEPVTGTTPAVPMPVPSAVPTTSVVDEPLLSDAADFRARWQQAQAAFVDDPREAVGEAADLIEQTAQALVAAVRQRQRQLRDSWDSTPEAHGTEPVNMADTEQLRLMMQRYRALFNQLCRP
jgi:hypothetical protein